MQKHAADAEEEELALSDYENEVARGVVPDQRNTRRQKSSSSPAGPLPSRRVSCVRHSLHTVLAPRTLSYYSPTTARIFTLIGSDRDSPTRVVMAFMTPMFCFAVSNMLGVLIGAYDNFVSSGVMLVYTLLLGIAGYSFHGWMQDCLSELLALQGPLAESRRRIGRRITVAFILTIMSCGLNCLVTVSVLLEQWHINPMVNSVRAVSICLGLIGWTPLMFCLWWSLIVAIPLLRTPFDRIADNILKSSQVDHRTVTRDFLVAERMLAEFNGWWEFSMGPVMVLWVAMVIVSIVVYESTSNIITYSVQLIGLVVCFSGPSVGLERVAESILWLQPDPHGPRTLESLNILHELTFLNLHVRQGYRGITFYETAFTRQFVADTVWNVLGAILVVAPILRSVATYES